MSTYTLYGTEHSYFTAKVRPYLRYKGIAHSEKQVTLWTYQRLIIPRTGLRFIPVVHTPQDEVIQDTSVIIDELERRFPQRSITPPGAAQKLVSLLFELYADEWFLLPGMHYRWSYRAEQDPYLMGEFGRVAGPLPGPLARLAGRQLCRPFRNSLPVLGITQQTAPAIEAWFEQFLRDFEAHLHTQDYLLGSRPCLGDFALAGPLYAHIWKDPYSRQILEQRGPNTRRWLQRINAMDQPPGEFLPDDEVPGSLLPMLRHLFAEHWPILVDSAEHLPAWLAQHPGKQQVSRALGWHEFQIGGVRARRLMFSNAIWMMQRPLDHYQSLSAQDRDHVDQLLQACGGHRGMQYRMPCRLERRDNRLVSAQHKD